MYGVNRYYLYAYSCGRHYIKAMTLTCRASIIQELNHFDFTKQLPEDAMHVLLEGIVPKHLVLFLSKVTSLKLVDIKKLNAAIQAFSY